MELRLCCPSSEPGEGCVPQGDGIAVPLNLLLELGRLLRQIGDRLITEAPSSPSSPPSAITMQGGEATGLDLFVPFSHRGESRRTVRVPLNLQVACRLLSENCPPKPLVGGVGNISRGGLQLWLAQRLTLYSRVELFARMAGANFRGRAEVVRAEAQPEDGRYEHGLRWLHLTPQAQAALAKMIRVIDPHGA